MSEQKPSIGRIVIFHDLVGNPKPAIITEVHSDDCVNLSVFSNFGEVYGPTSVMRGEDSGYSEYWEWPERV